MHNCSFRSRLQWHNSMPLKIRCKDENASIPTNNKTCQTQHGSNIIYVGVDTEPILIIENPKKDNRKN